MEWSTNIIKADRGSKPDLDPRDGLLYTQAPLELMRMITQQVRCVMRARCSFQLQLTFVSRAHARA